MTEDLLKFYVDCLIVNGYKAEIGDGKIKININIEQLDLILWVCLSRFFPYEIPDVFIDENSREMLPKIPHLHSNDSICIFDKGKVVPNFNNPERLLLETVESAIAVIRSGITNENKHDFIDEFTEYWTPKGIVNAQMFVEILCKVKTIYWCFKGEEIIIAESVFRLQEILDAIGGKKGNKKIRSGLLIPIDGQKVNEIPKTDVDIIKIIEENSDYKKQYNSFMQNNIDKLCLLVFNLIVPEGNILAGWVHCGPGVPNGFRKGHVNLKIAFGISKEKGFAVSIVNCHQNRLFERGGDGENIVWKRVAIIGCGSVGSFLADALKLYGTEHYVLVDDECLEYENIARHSCGYFGVDCAKVNVIGFSLQKHNPNITYIAYKENAHEVIEDKIESLNECDIIFLAVASVAVEHHLNKMILENKIVKPVVVLWVEPYMIGGHAIVIKKKQDLFKDIFDKNTFEYKYSIIKDGNNFLKREAGCQSTYMPYSGFILQQFIYRVLEYILSNCLKQKGNYMLTWCGKLSKTEKLDIELNDEYKHIEDFTLIAKRID